jgi:hypothetical protein
MNVEYEILCHTGITGATGTVTEGLKNIWKQY